MTVAAAEFLAAVESGVRPPGLTLALEVLWLDAGGDWAAAHAVAQDMPDPDGAWLHAYLHRREGDLGNAGYWYRRARQPQPSGSLEAEWRALVHHFAGDSA